MNLITPNELLVIHTILVHNTIVIIYNNLFKIKQSLSEAYSNYSLSTDIPTTMICTHKDGLQ